MRSFSLLLRRFCALFFAHRWIRFGFIGGLATATYFCLGLLFAACLPLPLLVNNALAYIISFAVSYLGQSLWTFQAAENHAVMLPKFALAQLAGLLMNSIIIRYCLQAGIAYFLSMLLASATVPILVYLICKYWVFRQTITHPDRDAKNLSNNELP